MKSVAIFTAGAILVAIFFQCCPSGAPEAPPIEPPPEVPIEEPSVPRAEPATTPTPEAPPPAVGLSPDNPAPLNHTLIASNGAALTIHGITSRGEEATRLVKDWNIFNEEPGEGKEFVIVSASARYEGGDEETLVISPFLDFRAVTGGVILQAPMLVGDELLDGEMFADGAIDGFLVFEVPAGSSGLVVIYTVMFEESYYLATE